MIPLTACTSPISSRINDPSASCAESLAATPRSIARPITAGITAWSSSRRCRRTSRRRGCATGPFAIHHRNRPGDRWSAVPGWSRGSWRTAPTVRERGQERTLFGVGQEAAAEAPREADRGGGAGGVHPYDDLARLAVEAKADWNARRPAGSTNTWASQRAGWTGSSIRADRLVAADRRARRPRRPAGGAEQGSAPTVSIVSDGPGFRSVDHQGQGAGAALARVVGRHLGRRTRPRHPVDGELEAPGDDVPAHDVGVVRDRQPHGAPGVRDGDPGGRPCRPHAGARRQRQGVAALGAGRVPAAARRGPGRGTAGRCR